MFTMSAQILITAIVKDIVDSAQYSAINDKKGFNIQFFLKLSCFSTHMSGHAATTKRNKINIKVSCLHLKKPTT